MFFPVVDNFKLKVSSYTVVFSVYSKCAFSGPATVLRPGIVACKAKALTFGDLVKGRQRHQFN